MLPDRSVLVGQKLVENAKIQKIDGRDLRAMTVPTITHCLKITQNVAFEYWHFPPIFVLLKLTCLVTLFDRKQKLAKIDHFWHF